MAGVNRVILIGNLGRDPEIRFSKTGTAIGKLNIAVSERRKNGDEWEDHTEWVRVTLFGRTAENAGQYLTKGRQVYVEGRMQTSKYTDQQGQEKWSTEVVCSNLVYLSSPAGSDGGTASGGGGARGNGSRNSRPQRDSQPQGNDGFYDDQLPF